MAETRRISRLAAQLLPNGVQAASVAADWDEVVASVGHIDLPGGLQVVPCTPLIGAEVIGLDLKENPLTGVQLDLLTKAFLRYKVLMIRSGGRWKLDKDEHTRFAQQLSEHWNLRPDTEQKKLNHNKGLSVHPFIPQFRGYPHIWPVVPTGGKQSERRETRPEDIVNVEQNRHLQRQSSLEKQKERPKGPQRTRWSSQGGGPEENDSVRGASAFHQDDGFFHQPPSAVVLNALELPKVGGDTVFADMEAAYRGLPAAMQEQIRPLTHTMGWEHIFTSWVQEAKVRSKEDGDDSFWEKIEEFRRDYPPSVHPVVRQHPVTGALSIYANRGFTSQINGLPAEEGRKLFRTLVQQAERPEYQVRMQWQNEGDVCVYDNRCTNHYAVSDYGNMGPRVLHHIALLGEPTKNADGEVIG